MVNMASDKTREQRIWEIEYSCDHRPELAERIVNLEDENDKLRKIAKSALGCVDSNTNCFVCRSTFGGCTLRSAMIEAGIEVD